MNYPACYDELRAVSLDGTSLTHQVGALTPGMPGAHVCCMMCREAHDCLYGIHGRTGFGQYGVTDRATLMSFADSDIAAPEVGDYPDEFAGSDIAAPEICAILMSF